MSRLEEFISNKSCSKQLVSWVSEISSEDEQAFDELLAQIKPSANGFRDLASLLREISLRDSTTITDIFIRADLNEILSNDKLSPNDKQKILKQTLKKIRYPELAKLEAALNKEVQSIRKNYAVSIELPDDLEGMNLKTRFNLRSKEDFSKASERLKEISEGPELMRIYSLLSGEIDLG